MIPATVSGWFTWKRHYRGAPTRLFRRKIQIAFSLLGLSIAISAWRLSLYTVVGRDTRLIEHYAFFFVAFLLIAGAAAEGYYGGRLAHH